MAKVVSVHSFRGGTGKSNTTANVAASLALAGWRVGVIDTDIQSPGIHVLFRLDESEVKNALNDFLFERCAIAEAAYDVPARLEAPVPSERDRLRADARVVRDEQDSSGHVDHDALPAPTVRTHTFSANDDDRPAYRRGPT